MMLLAFMSSVIVFAVTYGAFHSESTASTVSFSALMSLASFCFFSWLVTLIQMASIAKIRQQQAQVSKPMNEKQICFDAVTLMIPALIFMFFWYSIYQWSNNGMNNYVYLIKAVFGLVAGFFASWVVPYITLTKPARQTAEL